MDNTEYIRFIPNTLLRSNAANNLTKESAVSRVSETQIGPKQESITVHKAETYLKSLTSRSSY